MAITQVTTTALPTNKIPAGHTPPAYTPLTSAKSVKRTVISVAAAGITHASETDTALTALVAAIDTAVGTYVDTTLHIDALDTVSVNAFLTDYDRVNSLQDDDDPTQDLLTGVDNIKCQVRIEWE